MSQLAVRPFDSTYLLIRSDQIILDQSVRIYPSPSAFSKSASNTPFSAHDVPLMFSVSTPSNKRSPSIEELLISAFRLAISNGPRRGQSSGRWMICKRSEMGWIGYAHIYHRRGGKLEMNALRADGEGSLEVQTGIDCVELRMFKRWENIVNGSEVKVYLGENAHLNWKCIVKTEMVYQVVVEPVERLKTLVRSNIFRTHSEFCILP